jgi:plastocyanin
MKLNGLLRAAAVFLLVAGCSGGGGGGSTGPGINPPPPPPPPPPAGSNTIVVANNNYTPGTQTVANGATVNWSWNSCTGTVGYDQTCVQHSVTFDDGQTSPTQDQGSYSRTFTVAGTYKYHCQIHGNTMSGTITVQ